MGATEVVAKMILSLQPLVTNCYFNFSTVLTPILSLLLWYFYGVSNDISSHRASTTCDPSDHYGPSHFEVACLLTGNTSQVLATRMDDDGVEKVLDLTLIEFNPMLLLAYTFGCIGCLAVNKGLITNYLLSTANELATAPDTLLEKIVEHFCKNKKLYRWSAIQFYFLVERLPLVVNIGFWLLVDWIVGQHVGFSYSLVCNPSLLMVYLPDTFKCVFYYSSIDGEVYGDWDSSKCLLPLNKKVRVCIVLLYLIMAVNILFGVYNLVMRLLRLCCPCLRRRHLMNLTGQADVGMQTVAEKLVRKMSFDELFHLEAIGRNIPQHKRYDFLSSVAEELYPSNKGSA